MILPGHAAGRGDFASKPLLLIALGLLFPALLFAQAALLVQSQPAFAWTSRPPALGDADIDWTDYQRYYERPSALCLGLELSSGPARIVFRVDFRPDFLAFATGDFWTNLPFAVGGIDSISDVNMPTVSFFEFRGERLTASLGRRALAWGPGRWGLAVSDNAPSVDHLALGYAFPSRRGRWEYQFFAIGADRPAETLGFLASGDYKSIFAHRVLWEGENARVGISELNLLRGVVPSLVDISPFGVYHNLYMDGYSNVMLTAFAEWRAGRARLYGEFSMDDLVMPWESFTGRPTAFGFMAGGQLRLIEGRGYRRGPLDDRDYALRDSILSDGGGLSVRLEHYRTTAYMYGRETEYGKWSLPDHRLVGAFPFYLNEANAFVLGFPWGPDTALTTLSFSWESRRAKAEASASLLRKGSRTIDSAYDTTNAESDWFDLTGPVKTSFVIDIAAEYSFAETAGIRGAASSSFGGDPWTSLSIGFFFAGRIGSKH